MKRIITFGFAVLMLLGFTSASAGTAGTASDPLISRSYLTDTYIPAVMAETKTKLDTAFGSVSDTSLAKLDETFQDILFRFGVYPDYEFTQQQKNVSVPSGKGMHLLSGASFTLTSGSAILSVKKGAVINLSAGTVAPALSAVTPNQRYFCTDDTSAVFSAASNMECQVDGYYKTAEGLSTEPMNFTDVTEGQWFYNAVFFVYMNNLFKGTSQTAFSPHIPTTRGMFVTVLHRMAGEPAVSSSHGGFSDVVTGAYCYDAVIWANANNIVNGVGDGTFRPNDAITREQMAAIMYRYADFLNKDISSSNQSIYNSFPDKDKVSAFALNPMIWATAKGLITGSDGYLLPGDSATRAQVAQIITRFYQLILG